MKIVFMGTPVFAVSALDSLYEEGYEIELVVTQKDRPRGRGKKMQYTAVKERALQLDLEVFQPDDINSEEAIKKIKDSQADLIVVVAYGQILTKDILEFPKYGCLNIHASLLPKYRGAAPINWAIINGDKETGVTIMEMEEGLDTGPMLEKAAIPIEESDDYSSLHDKLAELGADLIVKSINSIKEGRSSRTLQDQEKSTYAPMIFRDTGRIDWGLSASQIINLMRGLSPWPGIYTNYDDQVMKIHKASLSACKLKGQPGEILKVSKEGVYIQAAESILLVEELQFPNKRRMTVADYIAGNDILTGKILK